MQDEGDINVRPVSKTEREIAIRRLIYSVTTLIAGEESRHWHLHVAPFMIRL